MWMLRPVEACCVTLELSHTKRSFCSLLHFGKFLCLTFTQRDVPFQIGTKLENGGWRTYCMSCLPQDLIRELLKPSVCQFSENSCGWARQNGCKHTTHWQWKSLDSFPWEFQLTWFSLKPCFSTWFSLRIVLTVKFHFLKKIYLNSLYRCPFNIMFQKCFSTWERSWRDSGPQGTDFSHFTFLPHPYWRKQIHCLVPSRLWIPHFSLPPNPTSILKEPPPQTSFLLLSCYILVHPLPEIALNTIHKSHTCYYP